MKQIIIYILPFLALGACTSGQLEEQAYKQWVENPENGLIVRKEIGQFAYELFYKPLPYQLLQAKDSVEATEEQQHTEYYTLKIESLDGQDVLKSGARDVAEYNNRLFYLADYIQQDLSLIQGGDTLPCLFAHYERNYGLAPYAKVTLAFEVEKKATPQEKTIRFNDPVFGAGPVQFYYPTTTLNNIPKLKQ
ncbi:MAG: hypothetical protein N4A35_01155 [Flavobacteriales bacterium]|jgi:hypothetical protein|nr:hypothetical protein [Flavobacteriales bacterium]